MISNAWIQTHAINHLPAIHPVYGCIGIQFIKIGYAHGQISIGEEFDRFGFSGAGKQYINISLDRTFLQQTGKGFCAFRLFSDNNTGWIQIVIQRPALTQKLGRKEQVLTTIFFSHCGGKPNRHCRFNYHHRIRIDHHNILNNSFHRAGVKIIGLGIVVRRGCNDDVISACICFMLIQCCMKLELFVGQKIFNLGILNR